MAHAFDALLRGPEVDPHRVAVVGHDYGAMYAALLAARDPRVAALAALAPDATWEHWFLAYWLDYTGDRAAAYARLFAGLQPVAAVAAVARRRPVLLQFADDDPYVDEATRQRFGVAAPAATVGVHHDAGHHLDLAALTERTAWLTRVLRLPY
jgi:dienelactone hydrolase